MSLARIVLALVGAWFLSKAWRLYVNYQAAAKSGLPYLIWPIDPENIFFIVLQMPMKSLLRLLLPTSWYERASIGIMCWEFDDKNRLHERVGPAIIFVTAGVNQLWCADPAMTNVILARRKDFVQLPLASKVMRFLGENILTSDGETWARQRRLVAPNLNERISEKVWAESLAQARQMTAFFLQKPAGLADDTISSMRAVAINVLGRVGYDQPKPFHPMELPSTPDAPMTYVEAISICTELLVVAALLPGWLLRLPFMPTVIRTVGAAMANLPGLTEAMLEEERRVAAETDAARDNVMSMLVRLSDQGRADDRLGKKGAGGATGQFLTEEEIAGNLFIFTGAGFDTTANMLTYAVALLAVYPEWQAWIQEEIDVVFGAAAGAEGTLDYTTCFPKLNRCLALMCETLRLFPPVIHISRSIAHTQTLTVSGHTYTIPGPCSVFINSVGLHHDRNSWGPDADTFRPSRWLVPGAVLGADGQVITPQRGTFLAWSGGPRVCPGQKMSQVEFVTVVSTLFARLRVEPVGKKGRALREARDDFKELVQDSTTRLTLQMNRPEEFKLRWLVR
ncbi:cytochrome P450 [Coniochaeta ligniaria NRRL 30616]|uniref:Cytochrome P450 n=1 Tax=Coniochaeta ligniaria NRRL 30616 TaxID=1408157 RepID=A0A1J7IGP7_9PEZI|nr:cytochrome P450 [Coniochaeta ligniaria NRRL 30616]